MFLLQDGPPEYEAAVAMLSEGKVAEDGAMRQDMEGIVLRKKSLTSNLV